MKNNQENWNLIYEKHAAYIYHYLLFLTGDENLADELTQETFYRAYMNHEQFRGDSNIRTWLCKIAKNAFYANDRTKKHLQKVKRRFAGETETSDTQNILEAGEILQYAQKLPKMYREVFLLHVLEEISLAEIARKLGRSNSWARVTFYRAKKMIQERMGKKDEL